MSKEQKQLRQQLIDTACQMGERGLNQGTAGNLSVKTEENREKGFLITPSGMHYHTLSPDDIVFINFDGQAKGIRKPSSEWRFHRDLYQNRPEAGAILHTHSPFASSIACQQRDIPAFHYMIARFGGDSVRCAHYATFGTQALSDAALLALQERSACLLANHGMLVFGKDLEQTLGLGIELESLCEQYWRTCQLGEPVILDKAEMKIILGKFASYGQ